MTYWKNLQLLGALPPDPYQGLCPLTPPGAYCGPQTPASFSSFFTFSQSHVCRGSIYVWEQGKRNKQGGRKKILILATCALGYVENTEERCRKHREIYLGTQLELKTVGAHTHTHILSLMTDSVHSTPERGSKSVMCTVFETAVTVWPSHQLAATHCERRAEGRVHRRAACEVEQKIGHRFSISKWPEGRRIVLCPVSNLCTGVSLSSAGRLVLCTRGQSCSLRDQV